jgi:hypothetical protein
MVTYDKSRKIAATGCVIGDAMDGENPNAATAA